VVGVVAGVGSHKVATPALEPLCVGLFYPDPPQSRLSFARLGRSQPQVSERQQRKVVTDSRGRGALNPLQAAHFATHGPWIRVSSIR